MCYRQHCDHNFWLTVPKGIFLCRHDICILPAYWVLATAPGHQCKLDEHAWTDDSVLEFFQKWGDFVRQRAINKTNGLQYYDVDNWNDSHAAWIQCFDKGRLSFCLCRCVSILEYLFQAAGWNFACSCIVDQTTGRSFETQTGNVMILEWRGRCVSCQLHLGN